jgi:hypothetical protein
MKMFLQKLLPVIVIFISFINASQAKNGKKNDTIQNTVCLEVLGIALDSDDQPVDGVEVKLFQENSELEWTEITNVKYHDHSFFFRLEANQYYTIEISKPGYVSRSIAISTAIPSSISLKELFRYEFEVGLFKEEKNMNDFYFDFPVALISYNPHRDVFDNNFKYTKHIKTMIGQPSSFKSN